MAPHETYQGLRLESAALFRSGRDGVSLRLEALADRETGLARALGCVNGDNRALVVEGQVLLGEDVCNHCANQLSCALSFERGAFVLASAKLAVADI